MKYKKDGNIESWHYKGNIYYQEITYEAVAGSNPYLYDSDWDFYGETEVVCEFVLDGYSKEKMVHVRELNNLLESGELEELVEALKNGNDRENHNEF